MGNSSGTPPDYEGRIALDPTLLDVERLEAALETGIFELSNSRVHQNLVLHHLGHVRNMVFFELLLRHFSRLSMLFYPLHILFSQFPSSRKDNTCAIKPMT